MFAVFRTFSLITVLFAFSECYNILVVFPHYGKSHFALYGDLFKELATRGHNVTVISYFPQEKIMHNYRDVILRLKEAKSSSGLSFDDFKPSRFENYVGISILKYYTDKYCVIGFESEELRNFLKEDIKFDLLLLQSFNSECFMGLVKKFEAPVIGLSSNLILPWFFDWFGNPSNPSYIADMNMELSNKMNFFERVENTFCHLYFILGHRYLLVPTANKYSKKYLGFDLEKNRDVFYNTSLLFVPTHYSSFGSIPLVPNIIEVGGIHIQPPKGLPEFFSDYINKSSNGVIYFSMGSTLKGHTFPKDKRNAFLRNFEKLSERVIWKWENETMEGKPDNVLLSRWTPQLEIICDPNVKAFIYHGGLLSGAEAVYCGIPQIILPQFGDQFRNAKALEHNGVAVILKMTNVNEKTVKEALDKVLSPAYQRRAKELSERYKDRPMSPIDTAIYWVEYVARHKGAPFMRTGAVNMPLYQYLLLDVVAFVLVSVAVSVFILYWVCKRLISLVFRTDKKKVD